MKMTVNENFVIVSHNKNQILCTALWKTGNS